MRTLFSITMAVVLAVSAGCSSTDGPPEDAKSACRIPPDASELTDAVIVLVNELRVQEGLTPLESSPILGSVADDFACEMIESGFFAHENPSNRENAGERLTKVGYIYYSMGENLAAGQTSAAEVVEDWLASPEHRENILSPYWREVGVAVRTGGPFGWYWVQEFAEPLDLGE